MGTCLALHRIEPTRLDEAEAVALEVAARRPPIEERVRLGRPLGLEVAQAYLDALDRSYIDVYDLDKMWIEVEALTGTQEWAGLWRPPLPDASLASRAFFGTHLPPRAIAATLDFPVRWNAPAEVGPILSALEGFDLEAAVADVEERGVRLRFFGAAMDPQVFPGERVVAGVTALYRRAAEHGHTVVAAMY